MCMYIWGENVNETPEMVFMVFQKLNIPQTDIFITKYWLLFKSYTTRTKSHRLNMFISLFLDKTNHFWCLTQFKIIFETQ